MVLFNFQIKKLLLLVSIEGPLGYEPSALPLRQEAGGE
jgi:hypothetical protein